MKTNFQNIPVLLRTSAIEIFFIIAGLLVLAIFFYLSFFNHPAADDFSFTVMTLRIGFFDTMVYWYTHWTGCMLSTALVSINPLVFDWWFGYKLFPVIFIALFILSIWFFICQISDESITIIERVAVLFMVLFLFFFQLPDISYNIYWMTGLLAYQLGFILILVMAGLLFSFISAKKRKNQKFLLIAFVLSAIMHLGETYAVVILGIILLLFLLKLFLKHEFDRTLFYLLLVACVVFLFIFFAPGIAMRFSKSNNGNHVALLSSLQCSIVNGILITMHSIFALSMFSIVMLPLFVKLASGMKQKSCERFLFVHPVISFIIMIILPICVFFPVCYSTGGPAYGRIHNMAFFFLLMSWGYFMLTLSNYFFVSGKFILNKRIIMSMRIVATAIVFVLVLGPNNIRAAVGDIFLGRAKDFDRQLCERYDYLHTSSCDTCIVDPLRNFPASFYTSDIVVDENNWKNIDYSNFFHKKSIRVKN